MGPRHCFPVEEHGTTNVVDSKFDRVHWKGSPLRGVPEGEDALNQQGLWEITRSRIRVELIITSVKNDLR